MRRAEHDSLGMILWVPPVASNINGNSQDEDQGEPSIRPNN